MVKYLSFHDSSFALRYFLMCMARPWCDTSLVFICVLGECLAWCKKSMRFTKKHNCSPPLCFRKAQCHYFFLWVHATYIEVSLMYEKKLCMFSMPCKTIESELYENWVCAQLRLEQGPYCNKPLSLRLGKTRIPFIEHCAMQKVVDSAQNMV